MTPRPTPTNPAATPTSVATRERRWRFDAPHPALRPPLVPLRPQGPADRGDRSE